MHMDLLQKKGTLIRDLLETKGTLIRDFLENKGTLVSLKVPCTQDFAQ